ncbi:MAG TPA: hypothetical protein VN944_00535 [Nitrospiria bacterium]|nr:hypothetical protein [Nitrospiria bacterium]
MKLRNYLEMKLEGEIIWPDLNFFGSNNKALRGTLDIEKSILKNVSLKKTVEYYTHLDIEVDFEGRTYSTAFLWDDQLLLSSLYDFLKENIGKSMRDIGSLEFPS